MRTNYIEYHLRLHEHRPKQGKLFSEEYPEPSIPAGTLEPAEPSMEHSYSSFGSEDDSPQAAISSSHTTSVAQTIFNVVRCLTCAVVRYTIKWRHTAFAYMVQANLFIGLGLLSTAYALKLGGWAALLGLAANAAFFAIAGKHVIDALAHISAAVLAQIELASHVQEQDTKQSQSAAAASTFHSLNNTDA